MSATVTCNDFTDRAGKVHKGCGATLRWPNDKEKAAGLKRPLNPDGTAHPTHPADEAPKASSSAAPSATSSATTGTKAKSFDRPYYEGITEFAEVGLKEANSMLKLGWETLKIVEKQDFQTEYTENAFGSTVGRVVPGHQVTVITYVMGKRV